MLCGVFRTKERKIIAAILGFIVITVGIFALMNQSDKNQYVEHAVMAENYLKAGNYEQAVEAYRKAMSMKDSDKEFLSIGLAQAYVGVNDYDKALAVLRSRYQKTSTITIKEKIEEVTSEKTDYDYLQSISRADIYFSNKEYDKAVTEYERAKLIKSKEVTSYLRIAEAYIEKKEYALAQDEVLEGQAITQSQELNEIHDKVSLYLSQEQYNTMVTEAAEYIYQENYEDGIEKYKEAISLLPKEVPAYSGLAEAYVIQKKYYKAVILLQDALKKNQSDILSDLLGEATILKEIEDERNNLLTNLYNALNEGNTDEIMEVMNSTFFQERIAKDAPIYFGNGEGNICKSYGMIVYNREDVYFGDIKDDIKVGNGIYFILTESNQEQGYYYYEGEWKNDIPSGVGKTEEVSTLLGEDGEKFVSKTITEGIFNNANENGIMKKLFYVDGEETGSIQYLAQNGIPLPLNNQKELPSLTPGDESYVISKLYQEGQPSEKYYIVKPKTTWGVKPFMKIK